MRFLYSHFDHIRNIQTAYDYNCLNGFANDKVERMIECLLALFECQARSEKRGAFCSLTFTFCISNLLWKPGMQIMGLK